MQSWYSIDCQSLYKLILSLNKTNKIWSTFNYNRTSTISINGVSKLLAASADTEYYISFNVSSVIAQVTNILECNNNGIHYNSSSGVVKNAYIQKFNVSGVHVFNTDNCGKNDFTKLPINYIITNIASAPNSKSQVCTKYSLDMFKLYDNIINSCKDISSFETVIIHIIDYIKNIMLGLLNNKIDKLNKSFLQSKKNSTIAELIAKLYMVELNKLDWHTGVVDIRSSVSHAQTYSYIAFIIESSIKDIKGYMCNIKLTYTYASNSITYIDINDTPGSLSYKLSAHAKLLLQNIKTNDIKITDHASINSVKDLAQKVYDAYGQIAADVSEGLNKVKVKLQRNISLSETLKHSLIKNAEQYEEMLKDLASWKQSNIVDIDNRILAIKRENFETISKICAKAENNIRF